MRSRSVSLAACAALCLAGCGRNNGPPPLLGTLEWDRIAVVAEGKGEVTLYAGARKLILKWAELIEYNGNRAQRGGIARKLPHETLDQAGRSRLDFRRSPCPRRRLRSL